MPPARFERTASGLGILRSIHLSYGGAVCFQVVSMSTLPYQRVNVSKMSLLPLRAMSERAFSFPQIKFDEQEIARHFGRELYEIQKRKAQDGRHRTR